MIRSIGKDYTSRMTKSRKGLKYYLNSIQTSEMSEIFLQPITTIEVAKYINNLKPKKSTGYDNINNILLIDLWDIISEPLSAIFNNSLMEGIFPEKMKTSKVIPLHKSKKQGRDDQLSTYQPPTYSVEDS